MHGSKDRNNFLQNENQYQKAPRSALYLGAGEPSEVEGDSIPSSASPTNVRTKELYSVPQERSFTENQQPSDDMNPILHPSNTDGGEILSSAQNFASVGASHPKVDIVGQLAHGDGSPSKQAPERSSGDSSANSPNAASRSRSSHGVSSPNEGASDHRRAAPARTEAPNRPSKRAEGEDSPSVGSSFSDIDGMTFHSHSWRRCDCVLMYMDRCKHNKVSFGRRSP